MNLLKRVFQDERGQDLAEYGIALAVIGLGAGLAAATVAEDTNTIWNIAKTAIEAAL